MTQYPLELYPFFSLEVPNGGTKYFLNTLKSSELLNNNKIDHKDTKIYLVKLGLMRLDQCIAHSCHTQYDCALQIPYK